MFFLRAVSLEQWGLKSNWRVLRSEWKMEIEIVTTGQVFFKFYCMEWPSKDVHTLISGACKYVTYTAKGILQL